MNVLQNYVVVDRQIDRTNNIFQYEGIITFYKLKVYTARKI